MPSRYFSGTGTPMTGSGVTEASMPGQVGGAPGAGDDHLQPAAGGRRAPYAIISSGIRCAETTSAS